MPILSDIIIKLPIYICKYICIRRLWLPFHHNAWAWKRTSSMTGRIYIFLYELPSSCVYLAFFSNFYRLQAEIFGICFFLVLLLLLGGGVDCNENAYHLIFFGFYYRQHAQFILTHKFRFFPISHKNIDHTSRTQANIWL